MRRQEGVVVKFDDPTWEKYCAEVIKKEDWHDFKTSERWFDRLETNSDHDTLPESTRKGCDHWMPRYLVFTWMTPDELIEEALIDDEKAEARIKKFLAWAKTMKTKSGKPVAGNSAHIGAHGYVRGFYKHNKINTSFWKNPKVPPSQVKQTDAEHPVWLITKKPDGTMAAKLNRPLLQDFLSRLNHRDQIVWLASVDAGNDINFVLYTTVGFIRNSNSTSERLFKSHSRDKNLVHLGTFFGKQSLPKMRRYEKTERKDADDAEPLFVTTMAERKRQFYNYYGRSYTPADVGMLPPASKLTNDKFSENCRNATIAMGITLEKGQQSPFRPKRARHIHNQACDFAKIPDAIKRIFEGRSPSVDGDYKSREELEYFFEILEPFIQILTEPQEDIQDLKISQMEHASKLKKEFDNYKKETDAKIADMQRQHREDITHPIDDDATNKRIEKILKKHKII